MSYTVEDFRAMMDGTSTKYVARFAESKWGRNAGDTLDPDDDESVDYYVTSEEIDFEVEGMGYVELAICWGGEGDGAETGNVVKVTAADGTERFFEQRGRYSSWDSTYYDEWNEVEPYEKTVVRYRPL